MSRRAKTELLKFRCSASLVRRFEKVAARDRRMIPDLMRIMIEDYLAVREPEPTKHPNEQT